VHLVYFYISAMMTGSVEGLVQHQGTYRSKHRRSPPLQHQQLPLLRLIAGPGPSAEDEAMRDVADFITNRIERLPRRSPVAVELAYVARRLELASQSPPQGRVAVREAR
jgi:hypothetical protein